MAVWMSRHPGLNASIADALAALRPHLLRGAVESASVALLDQAGAVVEQYAFDVEVDAAVDVPATYRCVRGVCALCELPSGAACSSCLPSPQHTDRLPPPPPPPPPSAASRNSDVESQLASALTRIALLEAAMSPVARGTTFTLLVATHDVLQGPQADADDARGAAHAAGGVLGAGSGWSRVDPGDPEAALSVPIADGGADLAGAQRGGDAGGRRAPVTAPLKTVRAGRMAIDLRLVHWR